MSAWYAVAAVGITVLAVAGLLLWSKMRARLARANYERHRSEFHLQRERLEAKFFELAGNSGKPRGLRWTDCSFDDEVTYARHRQGGELCAFVAVTIAFEAIEGGGMEEVEAVSNLRAATAVFRLDHGKWQTDGRAIFNLNPTEAIAYYQDNLVLVGQE
jgi:hypothetical protein